MLTRRPAALAAILLLVALASARAHVVQHCPEADNCGRVNACDDGNPCTIDYCEVTENGEGCCEHHPTSPCLDTFLCYDVSPVEDGDERLRLPFVQLQSDFEERQYRVNPVRALCNPANRGAGTHDPKTRLQRYPIVPVAPASGVVAKAVKVKSPLGTARVDLMRSDALLVPAAVDLLAPPGAPPGRFDRFACHDVRSTKDAARTRRGLQVKLSDHFTGASRRFEVGAPERLCATVKVDGADVVDACGAFLCYGISPAEDESPFVPLQQIWVRDGFAVQQVDARGEGEVCVPAVVNGRTCLPQGFACETDADCTTTHCVDGVCCGSACDAPCHACLGSLTGRPHGLCAPATGDVQCPPPTASGAQ